MSVDLLPKTTTAPLTEDPIDRDELEALIEEARQRTRRRRRRYVATLLVVLVALVGLLRLSHGRVHGVSTASGSVRPLAMARLPKNGKIAFVQDGFLKVSNPDGFGSRVLAGVRVKAGPAGPCAWPCEIGAPAWSPSGKQLAFLRGDGGSGPGCVSNCRHPDLSLFAIGSKGLGERRLAPCGNPCGSYPIGSFYWSPNGRKIVLPSVGLTLVDTRTGSIRRLSATGENPDPGLRTVRGSPTRLRGSLFVVPVAGVDTAGDSRRPMTQRPVGRLTGRPWSSAPPMPSTRSALTAPDSGGYWRVPSQAVRASPRGRRTASGSSTSLRPAPRLTTPRRCGR